MEEVEASMVAAAIRLSLQESEASKPTGPTGPASLTMVRVATALNPTVPNVREVVGLVRRNVLISFRSM